MTTELSELNLIQVLEQASNPQHAGSQVQRLAEQQLKVWEVQKGYYYLLQSVYLNISCSLQIRWLAIIQFKNGIEKYWRPTRVNAIDKDEKQSIRTRLFDMISEKNNQLCIQNAQAAARISRFDFPNEWPTLFEFLKQIFNNDAIWKDHVKSYNLIVHINQIIKILSTAKIGRCRPAMQSKIPIIFPLIVRIYLRSFTEWTTSSSIDANKLSELQVSYLSLKVLRRIVVDGYEYPHKDESVVEFMNITVNHFQLLLTHDEHFKRVDIYEKFIKCYGKLYYNLINSSPTNFILQPCALPILLSFTKLLIERASDVYQENSEINGDFWEQISIRGFLILKKIIMFINKRGAIMIKARNDKKEIETAVSKISSEFLTIDLAAKLIDLLMDWYLRLRPIELKNWSADPEEWINEQMSNSYEFQIRPCAENFFQDLISCFRKELTPYLLDKIENKATKLTTSLDDFLKKDAMFASFQLSAGIIADNVDFDRLLEQNFLPEATNSDTPTDQLKIIRRRISLIINEWCTIKCSDDSKLKCYKFFLLLLTEDQDKVVQLTAIQTLRTMIDDWEFNKSLFQPYLNSYVTVLSRKMLPSVSLTETRLYVLNTLSDMILQTKPLINKDLLIEILGIIPDLWNHANNDTNEAILANALLRLLRYLVTSLGKYSHITWQVSLPIIQKACCPSSDKYTLLYEDGFDLWLSLLQNFDSNEEKLDNRLLEYLPFLESGVQNQTEILPTLLEIVKSYTLILNKEQFFSLPQFSNIFRHISKYLLQLRDDSFTIVLSIWDILTLINETDSEILLLNNFFHNGVLNAVLDAVFLKVPLSSYQCGHLLQVISRISFINPNSVLEFLSSYHQSLPNNEQNVVLPENEKKIITSNDSFDDLIVCYIKRWCQSINDLYDPKLRKIHVLGISTLLKTGTMAILSEFPTIASLWIETMEEIHETNQGDCEKYHLDDDLNEDSTCEQFRYYNLVKNYDPVHNVGIKRFITEIMDFLKNQLGDQYLSFINSFDTNLFDNLNLFLSIN